MACCNPSTPMIGVPSTMAGVRRSMLETKRCSPSHCTYACMAAIDGRQPAGAIPELWDGRAAERIVEVLAPIDAAALALLPDPDAEALGARLIGGFGSGDHTANFGIGGQPGKRQFQKRMAAGFRKLDEGFHAI